MGSKRIFGVDISTTLFKDAHRKSIIIGQVTGMLGSMDRAIARLRWSLAQDIDVLAKNRR